MRYLVSYQAAPRTQFDRFADWLNRIPTYGRALRMKADYVPEFDEQGRELWPRRDQMYWTERYWGQHRYFGYHPINWYAVARRWEKMKGVQL